MREIKWLSAGFISIQNIARLVTRTQNYARRFSLRKKSAVPAVINDETTVVTQMNLALFRGLLDPRIFGCIRVLYMRETTAEIWIGHAEGSDWMGTQGGLSALQRNLETVTP